jgi:hypothetical protein
MKTSKEQQQRMLEQIEHDIINQKKFLAKLRYERRKWLKMEVIDYDQE